jgi:phosphoglycolate phosphatase-like HAD superfamily hydrolase
VLTQLDRAERIATAHYLGDVPDDMRMARAVGVVGVGIESSFASREVLLAAGATVVFGSVAEFVDDLLGPAGEPEATSDAA